MYSKEKEMNKKPHAGEGTGYYDIKTDDADKSDLSLSIEEWFYVKDVQQRKFFIDSEIEQCLITDIVRHILQINREDRDIPVEERRPIILYVTTCGGEVDAGYELIDVIENSVTPVYTVNLGYAYSMGLMIFIAGHKRFATKHSTFLMHDGTVWAYDSSSKTQDKMAFYHEFDEYTKQFVLAHSNITEQEYDDKQRVEWYMFAEAAKKHGFVDSIIGVDCKLEEVV